MAALTSAAQRANAVSASSSAGHHIGAEISSTWWR
jgi:hypothetical protein